MKVNVFKRTLAALVTGAMVAGSVGAVSAGATTMTNVVPGSRLKFDVNVTALEDKNDGPLICVEIHGESSNPNFRELFIAVKNSENCTFDSGTTQFKFVSPPENYMIIPPYGMDGAPYAIAPLIQDTVDFTGEFTFKMYYKPINAKVVSDYDFSVAVYHYVSSEENISLEMEAAAAIEDRGENTSASAVQYRLGDMDNSGKIEISDAYSAMKIANKFPNSQVSNAVVNHYLTTNSAWKNDFPGLICAEVADIDRDAMVELEDAQAILQHTSEAAIGKDFTNNAIGRVTTSTIEF